MEQKSKRSKTMLLITCTNVIGTHKVPLAEKLLSQLRCFQICQSPPSYNNQSNAWNDTKWWFRDLPYKNEEENFKAYCLLIADNLGHMIKTTLHCKTHKSHLHFCTLALLSTCTSVHMHFCPPAHRPGYHCSTESQV